MDPALPRSRDEVLRCALASANIPTLLLVVAHLSGSRRWLREPYLPTRTIALNDNDTAGLPEARQEEVRRAALELLAEVRDGRRRVPDPPSDEHIVRMLSVSLGEAVPPEYGAAMAEDGGFRAPSWLAGPALDAGWPRVLVVGAGVSGICMGVALRRLGLPFRIVERGTGVGGTWRDNNYPGAGVDTPSHLYSYSFAPRPGWSRYYPKQPEILDYLSGVVRDHGLLPDISFGTEVLAAHWREDSHSWLVRLRDRDGEHDEVADVLVSSVGLFNQPVVPRLPGLESFPGPAFHTARWDHGVSLAGKRVGVVGTGASAMQVVPEIADEADAVVVFQRSPQWVAPNANYLRPVHEHVRLLMAEVPGYRTWYRMRLMWMGQDKLHPTLRKDPDWPHPDRSLNATNDKHRAFFTRYLDEQLAGTDGQRNGDEAPQDKTLRDKALPDYPPYGKRILLDNNWFATLRRDDVYLVDSGVHHIDGATVRTEDGGRHELDVLVLATGFSARRMLHPMHIVGRSGVPLRQRWGDDDAWAHLGITVPDYPNLFLMYGPHTNSGHGGSLIFQVESQTHYIVTLLRRMVSDQLGALEVHAAVCRDYNTRIDDAHANMVWTHPGLTTYYRNAAGRVVTTIPFRLIDYWLMTRNPDLTEFRLTQRAPVSGQHR